MIVAAAYLRVSKSDNVDGDESLTLETQRRRIRALCEARGWEYGPEYLDEGISATKTRGSGTEWSRMLSEIGTGQFDVIVARDLDRLLRTLQDLVKLIELNAKVATVDGEIDLTTADGEFRATMLAAVARFEIRRKSERAIGANETRRKMGIPIMRARILGYDEDGVTQIDDEVEALRTAFEDFLAGVKISHVARDLTTKGYTTSKGQPWSNANIRSLLENARYKGVITKWDPTKKANSGSPGLTRRDRKSDQVYAGAFEPIINPDVFDAVQAKLHDAARRRHWTSNPKYLLVSIAYCGRCKQDDPNSDTRVVTGFYQRSPSTLTSGEVRTYNPVRTYVCKDHKHLSRTAEPLDGYINELVIARIVKGDLINAFRPKDKQIDNLDDLKFERIAAQERFENLATLLAEGVLDVDAVRLQSARLKARMNEIDAILTPAPSNIGFDLLTAEDPIEHWKKLDLERQRLIINELMTITLLPSGRGSKGFDPELVDVDWLK